MTYKLTIDQPNLGDEGEVYIHGLGTFQNGKTYLISDELALNFQIANMVDEGQPDNDPESESFGTFTPKMVPGRALDEAAGTMYGVTVTKEADGGAPGNTPSTPSTSSKPPVNTGADANGGDQ